jgi:hypothetical protein
MKKEQVWYAIVRKYWSGEHNPYTGILKDTSDKKNLGFEEEFHNLLSKLPDGTLVTITVKVGTTAPITKGFRWELTKPHTYERVVKLEN